jgi:NAD dependent epimerase/dehydratase family enzyme
MSDLVLDSHWVSAQKVLDSGFDFHFPTLEEAMNNLLRP